MRGVETLADDLVERRGHVRSRVALLLRSSECKPHAVSFWTMSSHLENIAKCESFGGVHYTETKGYESKRKSFFEMIFLSFSIFVFEYYPGKFDVLDLVEFLFEKAIL